MKSYSDLRIAWGQSLAEYHWQGLALFTFGQSASVDQAHGAVRSYFEQLGPNAYGFVAYELGDIGGRLHCHALIGGLYPRRSQCAERPSLVSVLNTARQRWDFGIATIEPYDPLRGGAWYVSKFCDDWEIIGRLPRHRRRRARKHSLSILESETA